ncbi:CPBP family intramembrane glutamic endopeptidase [Corynebacterium fournieri]|uniref:CPBP family intramembrane glutamic endopeptidase n=1 Tax=Corynebacterium fournieri TaxID=1852390 RepID=UPI0015C48E96|nr:CPBP family intramembrane glutamic endopeptidase [Corynebacterium fournieri]
MSGFSAVQRGTAQLLGISSRRRAREPAEALFAAPHIEPAQVVHAFFGGIAFALVARRHKSLWASIVAHLANNLLVGIIVIAGLLA